MLQSILQHARLLSLWTSYEDEVLKYIQTYENSLVTAAGASTNYNYDKFEARYRLWATYRKLEVGSRILYNRKGSQIKERLKHLKSKKL